MGHSTDHWMSTGDLSVQCIELLHRGQGPLGYMLVYVHGLLHTLGFGKGVLTWECEALSAYK